MPSASGIVTLIGPTVGLVPTFCTPTDTSPIPSARGAIVWVALRAMSTRWTSSASVARLFGLLSTLESFSVETVTVLVELSAAASEAVTGISIAAVPPTASTELSESVAAAAHVTVWPSAEQPQPERSVHTPGMSAVIPVGRSTVTETDAPFTVVKVPTLRTLTARVSGLPTRRSPECEVATARSTETALVVIEDELLPLTGASASTEASSRSVLTVTVLATWPSSPAWSRTSTRAVIRPAEVAAGSEASRTHETSCALDAEQSQPGPLGVPRNLTLVGSSERTLIGPTVAASPLFVVLIL